MLALGERHACEEAWLSGLSWLAPKEKGVWAWPRLRRELVEPARRYALWACLIFVVLFGVVHTVRDVTGTAPAAVERLSQGDPFLGDDMRTYAMLFARAFLTATPGHPEYQEAAVSSMLSPHLRSDAAITMPAHGRAVTVVSTSVAATARLPRDHALITVACVLKSGAVSYLAVPVLRDAHGGLLVSDYPAFVSPPPSASAPDISGAEEPLNGPDADTIERLLTDFFAEYLKGGVVPPVFLAPSALIAPLGRTFDHVDPVSVAVAGSTTGNTRVILQVLNARDALSKIGYTLRYRVQITRASATDRWLVNSIQGDPSS